MVPNRPRSCPIWAGMFWRYGERVVRMDAQAFDSAIR
jgi:hypothetical protein